jgi:hypothetical protein
MNIDTTSLDISRDQNSRVALAEVLHNIILFFLRYLSVYRGYYEVCLAYFIGQLINLPACVTENVCLCNCENIVEVAESIKFLFLFLNYNKILLEAF